MAAQKKAAAPKVPVKGQPKELGTMTNTEDLKPGGIPRTRKKVAIIGFATSSIQEARGVVGDPDFEIWGLNQLYVPGVFPDIVEKATRWFQMHTRDSYDQAVRDHKHHDWLAEQSTFPIYMQQKNDGIPMSVPFPRWTIKKNFRSYFTNSISWQLALAIYEGFEAIHVYGVDMAQDDEYMYQRPSVEYYLGFAEGRGISLHIPDQSDLLKTAWEYPFQDPRAMQEKFQARRMELRQRLNASAAQEQGAHDQRVMCAGALDNMNYVESRLSNVRDDLERPRKEHKD